jgi:hypothetical protein
MGEEESRAREGEERWHVEVSTEIVSKYQASAKH